MPPVPPCTGLQAACTPSRAGVPAPKEQRTGKGAKINDNAEVIAPPPQNASERQAWDRMSIRMESFHNYFAETFKQVYELADKYEQEGLTLRQYLSFAQEFEHHLQTHHGIEESYVFPILARKMPEFQDQHIEEHKKIHDGLDRYLTYISAARSNAKSYSPEGFREVLASFGPILFYHLDAEVKSLRGDNLRRYYTLDEVKRLPM